MLKINRSPQAQPTNAAWFIIWNNHLVTVIHERAECLVFSSKKFIPGREGQGEVTLYAMKKKKKIHWLCATGRERCACPTAPGQRFPLLPLSPDSTTLVLTRLLLDLAKGHKPSSPSTPRTFSRLANWVSTDAGMTNIWHNERTEQGCTALGKGRQKTWTVFSCFTVTLKTQFNAYYPLLFSAHSRFSGDWIFWLANLTWTA